MDFRKRSTVLGKALDHYLSRLDAGFHFRMVRLWRNWDRVVGEDVAALGRPLGHRDRVLLVGAEDHAAQQELVYWSPVILAVVHEFLGRECFDKVQVDLLMGRAPLDCVAAEKPGAGSTVPVPAGLGGLTGRMNKDSPVARCYAA